MINVFNLQFPDMYFVFRKVLIDPNCVFYEVRKKLAYFCFVCIEIEEAICYNLFLKAETSFTNYVCSLYIKGLSEPRGQAG